MTEGEAEALGWVVLFLVVFVVNLIAWGTLYFVGLLG